VSLRRRRSSALTPPPPSPPGRLDWKGNSRLHAIAAAVGDPRAPDAVAFWLANGEGAARIPTHTPAPLR
jgi:hypothetical protein